MDQVIVHGLEVTCIIGCGAPERVKAQRILVHLCLLMDTSLCGRTDALVHTVNYAALSKRVEAVCTGAQSFTLEHLCALVARECLFGPASGAGLAHTVRVRIEKPEALKRAKWPAVEVERSRAFFEAEDARWGPPRSGLVAPAPAPQGAGVGAGGAATALLCLGSNLGARCRNLRAALRLLEGKGSGAALPQGKHLRVVATSRLYETAAAYVADQPPFLNAAARVETNLTRRTSYWPTSRRMWRAQWGARRHPKRGSVAAAAAAAGAGATHGMGRGASTWTLRCGAGGWL